MISLQSRPVGQPIVPEFVNENLQSGISEYAAQMIHELAGLCASAGLTATAEVLGVALQVASEEMLEARRAADA